MDQNPEYKTPNMFPNDSFRTSQTITSGYFNEELN